MPVAAILKGHTSIAAGICQSKRLRMPSQHGSWSKVKKKRLYRSSDAVISGVCGGIADYFEIDSTLVRIIAVVLIILGFGFPVILYVILMIALPPDPGIAQGYVDARCETTETHGQRVHTSTASAAADPAEGTAAAASPGAASGVSSEVFGSTAAAASSNAAVGGDFPDGIGAAASPDSSSHPADQPPPPDPATRVTSPRSSATGATHTVGTTGTAYAASTPGTIDDVPRVSTAAPSTKGRNHSVLIVGALLIGIGILALLSNFVHISLWRFWPAVLIVVGVVYLFTPGAKGWSLERAGNAIVLITIGLALLAWMLQIIQTHVFVAAFRDLWPALLVVVGLAIIGGARKNSVVLLVSSLVLSATILIGLWVYGGLNWASLGTASFIIDGDGIRDVLADMPLPFGD